MKTSNKLLIAFFLLIPLGLLIFNVLLKMQYVKGNLVYEEYSPEETTIPLKPFQHVVYEGRMVTDSLKVTTLWVGKSMHIHQGQDYKMKLLTRVAPFLRYEQRGDTLFIHYRNVKTKLFDKSTIFDYTPLNLYVPAIASVTAQYGEINIDRLEQAAPLTLHLRDLGATLDSVKTSLLQLHAGASRVKFTGNVTLDTLAYRVTGMSTLDFEKPVRIGTLSPEMMDSTVRIGIAGPAKELQGLIK